ncbi:hypothetical protein V7S43_009406 [Phytophthora oleae]|uniref:START domain-containing protein n=1 Tax=Phytophthora oleae TaxID=2107226 RepID=A0ABD3FG29_9STRA
MERMRKTVAALELQKQQLMEHFAVESPSPCSSHNDGYRSPPDIVVSTSSSLYPSPSMPVTRDDYVQLAAEIEAFRRQNAAMVKELARRDLFNNSLRYRLLSFPPPDSRSGLQPTHFTHEQGMTYVWQTLERIHDARLLYASEERFLNRPTFLGWSQYSEHQGDIVTFGVKKALRNVTPQQLMDQSWQLQTNSGNLQRLGPSHVKTHITVLQEITDDVLIVERRTEDQSRTNESGGSLVLRTVYVLFRVDDDGAETLGMKTLDVPTADRMLHGDEIWWDIFYWIRVSPLDCTAEVSAMQEVTTVTEFGGTNACACEDLAASRLKELIFLAIRWETLAVAPFLLKE